MPPFLPLSFFNLPAGQLAQNLLGRELTCTQNGVTLSGIIVETEAYFHENDTAAHSARGETHATRALRMGPGTLYIHPMRAYVGLDIVAVNGSVLVRALQPAQGLPLLPNLCNGPGKLCRALGITKELYGQNITDPACPLHLNETSLPPFTIHQSPRIGITKNAEPLLRFTIQNNPYLSR